MQTGHWGASAEVMTRFKELRRIEAAIEHRNEAELRWALDYCRMRLRTLTMKRHEKRWREIEKQIRATLLAIEADSN
jgi:hypothetical protein